MELDKFIKQDIAEFLRVEQEKDISIKGVRDDEMSIFDIDRDYAKELNDQLMTHNLPSAKDIFDSVRGGYNRTAFKDPARKKIYAILKELFILLQNYIKEHGLKNSLSLELDYHGQQHYFDSPTMPDKILSALEKEQESKHKTPAAEEGQNLLRTDTGKDDKKGHLQADFIRSVAEQIANDIPMEESKELSKIFGGARQQVIVEREIMQPVFQQVNAAPSQAQPVLQGGTVQAQPQVVQAAPPQTVQAIPGQPQTLPPLPQIVQSPPQVIVQQTPQATPLQTQTTQVSNDTLRDMVNTITTELMQKREAQSISQDDLRKQVEMEAEHDMLLEQRKKQMMEDDLAKTDLKIQNGIDELAFQRERLAAEHKHLLETEAEDIKNKKNQVTQEGEMIDTEVKSMKELQLNKEKLQLLRTQHHNQTEIRMLEIIKQSMVKVNVRLLAHDILGAKKEYRHIRGAFNAFPNGEPKKKIQHELVELFNQIKFVEKAPIGKSPQRVLNDLKQELHAIRTATINSQFDDAREYLKRAKDLTIHINNEEQRHYCSDVIRNYERKLKEYESKHVQTKEKNIQKASEEKAQDSETTDMYLRGVFLLYNHRHNKAAEIFRQILEKDPDNIAAKIRLREAKNGSRE
ncbi:MAG: hypothetical protein KKG59_03495 [Nanoarchaeota archaeon]|nr:hypothetical protein [Nanoarchaeota archaeon]